MVFAIGLVFGLTSTVALADDPIGILVASPGAGFELPIPEK
ncbi:MAG: hypothetical protein ACI9MC_002691 [Kiritimatiellia bacterium]|jgi:hypothetical protein